NRPFRNGLLPLLLLTLLTGKGETQDIIVLDRAESVHFAHGYTVVTPQGGVVKSVPGPSDANIQAYIDVGGTRYFMSDWSLQRYQQGQVPNWILPVPPPQEMPDRVSEAEADRIAKNTPKWTPPDEAEVTASDEAFSLLSSASDFLAMGVPPRAATNLAVVEDLFGGVNEMPPEVRRRFQEVTCEWLLAEGNTEEASKLLTELIRTSERATPEEAQQLLAVGETALALDRYDLVIEEGVYDLNSRPLLHEIIRVFLNAGAFSRIETMPERIAVSDAFGAEKLGDAFLDLSMWELARDSYRASLKQRKGSLIPVTLYEKLATSLLRLGEKSEAESYWEIVRNEGRVWNYHLETARYLAQRGELEEAARHYFEFSNTLQAVGASELDVTDEYQAPEEKALVEAALSQWQVDEAGKAESVFETATEAATTGPLQLKPLLKPWGTFYRAQGKTKKAEEQLREWIREGKLSTANAALAWESLGKLEEAKEAYSLAAKEYGRNSKGEEEFIGESFDKLDLAAQVYIGSDQPSEFLLEIVIELGVAPRKIDPSWPQTLRHQIFVAALLSGREEELEAISRDRVTRDRDLMQRIIEVYPETRRLTAARDLRPFDVPFTLGDPELAANAVLQFKGVVLDSLARDRIRLNGLPDDVLQSAAFEELPRTREAFLQQSARGVSLDELAALEKNIRELEAAIFQTSSQEESTSLSLSQVDYKAVQSRLGKDEVLVEFCLYGEFLGLNRVQKNYAAVVVPATGQPELIPLGTAEEVEQSLETLLEALSNEQTAQLGSSPEARQRIFGNIELGAILAYGKIWKPLVPALSNYKRVFVSPDGILHFVPFAALLDAEGGFVAENWSLSHIGSGRDLLDVNVETKPKEKPTALLLANPAFDSDPLGFSEEKDSSHPSGFPEDRPLLATRNWSVLRQGLSNLPGTIAELQGIEPTLIEAGIEVTRRIGAEVTEETLTWETAPRILHLGTHGIFLPSSAESDSLSNPFAALVDPMARSFIALTGANETLSKWSTGEVPHPRGDGVMLAAELTDLNLAGTELVVLSACETGLGEVVEGEGVFGMKRSLRQAGAENLLTTLWSISDDGTGEVMKHFYESFTGGKKPGDALAETQRKLLRAYATTKSPGEAIYLVGPFIADEIRR
ncbi:MAG: CHAT domain-containing tetratricopeptide repeat protein, partial [Verrucomicrobiota bacterium]